MLESVFYCCLVILLLSFELVDVLSQLFVGEVW